MAGIKTRVPVLAVQKALVALLKSGQSTKIYDDVEPGAKLTYISIGAINVKPNGSKDSAIYDVSVQLHLWSGYQGKYEINSMMNDVATVLSYAYMDTSADGFCVISQETDFFEVFSEEAHGYHGVITVVIKIQDMEV